MEAAMDFGGEGGIGVNSGINGAMLANCHIASGENAASKFYIQSLRKISLLREFKILAAFKSRRDDSVYFITADATDFHIWRKSAFGEPKLLCTVEKRRKEFRFSYDYAKMNEFKNFDSILLTAFGTVVAFSETDSKLVHIETADIGMISGVAAFGNRIIGTFEGSEQYHWGDILQAKFNAENFASSEYGNDMTQAVRRTGSRLAVFTTKTIEIKDLSQNPDFPFAGYLYQNNYDVGAEIDTVRDIDGALYFLGQELNGLRFIYSLTDGALKKLTNENQAKLLEGNFRQSGTMQEDGNTFYCIYSTDGKGWAVNIINLSLFQLDTGLKFLDYLSVGDKHLRFCDSGIYEVSAGNNEYMPSRFRLPKFDFGAVVNIKKLEFAGEFLSSARRSASLTAARGWNKQAGAAGQGYAFFRCGLQKLNDLEFSTDANFRLFKIIANYELLSNASRYGIG